MDDRISPPRPDLQALGIEFGPTPVLAIGKDVYCDTSFQLFTLQAIFPEEALPTAPLENLYRAWSTEVKHRALAIVPLKVLPQGMIADRAKMFCM